MSPDPEADEFGPAQAGVGQDGHHVALIAARGSSEPLDFRAVGYRCRSRSGMRPAETPRGGVAVDAAVLVCDVENRPQKTQCRHLRPRADRQVVNKGLDVAAADLVDGYVTEPRLDPQLPVLGVAAPGSLVRPPVSWCRRTGSRSC